MNTLEARGRMRDLAAAALPTVERLISGTRPGYDERHQLREMVMEARSLLAEAGYPGEPVWRALQRADIGLQTAMDSDDSGYWQDIDDELKRAMESLDSLLGTNFRRDADFRIVT